jgi:uncharacterized protein (TIGR02611 family)
MKRVFIAIAGSTVLLLGILLLVLPGPAFIVIPAGLAILAVEFAWAKRWLESTKDGLKRGRQGFKQWFRRHGAQRDAEGAATE